MSQDMYNQFVSVVLRVIVILLTKVMTTSAGPVIAMLELVLIRLHWPMQNPPPLKKTKNIDGSGFCIDQYFLLVIEYIIV